MLPERVPLIEYTRVSTDEQAARGVSLDAQHERIAIYCRTEGLHLEYLFCDAGRTGGDMDRPGLRGALELLDSGAAGGIVVAKLDRLTRSLRDFETLIDRYFLPGRGKSLFVVLDPVDLETATGRMLARIRIAVGQHELETTIERTADAMAHKRRAGERLGTVPYGRAVAADGKTLVDHPAELATITLMRQWRLEGASYRLIADSLNAHDVPSRSGRPWAASTVQQILARDPARRSVTERDPVTSTSVATGTPDL